MIIILGILSAVMLISHSDKPVFLYLMNLYGLFTPGIATMFLMGVFWKRTTSQGAITAGLLTIPLSLIMEFAYPELSFFNRTGIVFWTCMGLCLVVSLFTPAVSEDRLNNLVLTKESFRLTAVEKEQNRGWRNPVIWWAIITAAVLFFYIRFFFLILYNFACAFGQKRIPSILVDGIKTLC